MHYLIMSASARVAFTIGFVRGRIWTSGQGGSISDNTKYSPVLHKVLPLWTLLWVPLCELQGRCMRSQAFTYYIHIHQSKRVFLYLHADSLYRSLVLITLVTTVLCSTIPYRHFSPIRKLPNCHNVITDQLEIPYFHGIFQ